MLVANCIFMVSKTLADNKLYRWKDASVISIIGPDAENFLQGYTTSDLSKNASNELRPMCITDIKGRVIASGWSTKQALGVDLIVHTSLKYIVESFLAPYIQFAKSHLVNDQQVVCHSDSGLQIADGHFVKFANIKSVNDFSESKDQKLLDLLTANKFAFIEAKVSQQFLPQQLGLHSAGAVDFNKGCYLGQEIIARVQFRGSVKREITITKLEKETVCAGDKLSDGSTLIQATESRMGLAVKKVNSP